MQFERHNSNNILSKFHIPDKKINADHKNAT